MLCVWVEVNLKESLVSVRGGPQQQEVSGLFERLGGLISASLLPARKFPDTARDARNRIAT